MGQMNILGHNIFFVLLFSLNILSCVYSEETVYYVEAPFNTRMHHYRVFLEKDANNTIIIINNGSNLKNPSINLSNNTQLFVINNTDSLLLDDPPWISEARVSKEALDSYKRLYSKYNPGVLYMTTVTGDEVEIAVCKELKKRKYKTQSLYGSPTEKSKKYDEYIIDFNTYAISKIDNVDIKTNSIIVPSDIIRGKIILIWDEKLTEIIKAEFSGFVDKTVLNRLEGGILVDASSSYGS